MTLKDEDIEKLMQLLKVFDKGFMTIGNAIHERLGDILFELKALRKEMKK